MLMMVHAYRPYRAIASEVAARMHDLGGDSVDRFLEATREMDLGLTAYSQQAFDSAQGHYEMVLTLLSGLHGSEIIQALSQHSLVSIYGMKDQFDKSLTMGRAALKHLQKEPRLAIFYASCLHDTGLTLVNVGQPEEGLKHLKQALAVYETLEEGAEAGAKCIENIAGLEALLAEQSRPASSGSGHWWSRLFGK